MAKKRRIEIFARRALVGKRWYFRFVAANGEIVSTSEGYNSYQACLDTALVVRDGFFNCEVIDV